MKKERELIWMVKLLNSEYVRTRSIKKQKSGCKRDFEILVGAPENDKNFRRFLNELIEQGYLVMFEKKRAVGLIATYVVDSDKLRKRMVENPEYEAVRTAVLREESPLGIRL